MTSLALLFLGDSPVKGWERRGPEDCLGSFGILQAWDGYNMAQGSVCGFRGSASPRNCRTRNQRLGCAGCMVVEMQTGQPLFPGTSDIDQLWLILKSCTEEQLEELSGSPLFQVQP